jgi:hypothetical protein
MVFLRSHIVRIALVVLLGHVAAHLLPPMALCCTEMASAMTDEETVCNCTHGPNAMCPMHKASKKSPPPTDRNDQTAKWCAGHGGSDHTAVTTVRVDQGRIEPFTAVQRPEGATARPLASVIDPSDLSRPPATPPPRA